ncbi:magnesium transporter MRS2-3 isoform X2 [Sesamum indicum]|uniref:Magnesium transporter n=1 Tax=Sesamum indicum TaxID=4182 RepID=A0A6I9SW70_SESIN|nr:magnesium transporter MRS2-3 isoform X2 [Sesamum indicum]
MRPAAPHPPSKHAEPRPGGSGEPLLLPIPGGHRKKVASVRAWLTVDSTGEAQVVEAGKHAIMRRTGLPGRDLRILDPVLSYPSTVLGRERAIVVNLEHIKAIITAQEVLFLNSTDPLVTPFVKKLQGIFRHRQAEKAPQEAGGDGNNVEWENSYNLQAPQLMAVADHQSFPSTNEEGNADGEQQVAENAHGLKLLPFEFVALEACLEAACSSLDNEAKRLEQEAHPALDKLTSKISTLNLERVRQIKSRLVAMAGRVQKVRDELEHLLDDDDDMAEMYLTDKLELQQLENSSASSINEQDGIVEEVVPPYLENRAPVENLMGCGGNSFVSDADIQETDVQQEQNIGESNTFRRHSHRTHTSMHSATSKNLDVEELEMILEAYFVQIDGTLNKLSTLREYVDDTEDYINIMLDDKQNHLLQMGVVLSTATVVVSAFVALTGVFGMNITIELFDSDKAGMPEFLWTVGGGTMGCLFLYIAAIAWCKHKRLLE